MKQIYVTLLLLIATFFGTSWKTCSTACAAERHDVRAVAFSPDGKLLLVAGEDGVAVLRDAHSGKEVRRLEGHRSGINVAVFSPDGKFIATGGGIVLTKSDDVIRLWDTASGQIVRRFAGRHSEVSSLAFSPDGRQLLSAGSYDDKARLWDVADGKEIRRFGPQPRGINAAAFSPDGKWIVTAGFVSGRDEGRFDPFNVIVWNAANSEKKVPIQARGNRATCLAFSAQAKREAIGLDSGHVELYDPEKWEWHLGVSHVEPGEDIRRVKDPDHWYAAPEAVRAIAFSPDGKWLLSGSDDKTARLWDVGKRDELRRFKHTDKVRAVAFSPDGKRIATASGETVIVWDASTGKELFRVGPQ